MAQRRPGRGLSLSSRHGVPAALMAASLLLVSISTKSIIDLPGRIVSGVFWVILIPIFLSPQFFQLLARFAFPRIISRIVKFRTLQTVGQIFLCRKATRLTMRVLVFFAVTDFNDVAGML